MRFANRRLSPAIVIVILFAGCGPTGAKGVHSSSTSWTITGDDGVPGIHQGTVESIKLQYGSPPRVTVVLWCAGAGSASSQGRAGNDGAVSQGTFQLSEGRQVDFHCEKRNGATAKVTIAGQTYESSLGSLFLIAMPTKEMNVKQMNVNVDNFPQDGAAIQKFALSHPDIAAFFAQAKQAAAAEPLPE